jgi:hypothetical protein
VLEVNRGKKMGITVAMDRIKQKIVALAGLLKRLSDGAKPSCDQHSRRSVFSLAAIPSLRRLCGSLAMLFVFTSIANDAAAQLTRPFSIRYSTNINGDIKLIGNTVMACSALPLAGNCLTASQGTANPTGINNNDWNMTNIDIDSDLSTFNSSRATLSVLPLNLQDCTGAALLLAPNEGRFCCKRQQVSVIPL